MIKKTNLKYRIGKNLAGLLAVGVGFLGGVKAEGIDICSVTNVAPIHPRGVNYTCADVSFNGRIPRNKIVLFYKYASGSSTNIIGGLTIPANSNEASTSESYLYASKTIGKAATLSGLLPGQVATNGLNNGSYWFGINDLNGNGKGGEFNSPSILHELGEYISPEQITFEGMPAFPPTGPIGSVRIRGYQDEDRSDIPDYFEAKYDLPNPNSSTNDSDSDGHTDRQEWVVGSNPTNAASTFGINSINTTSNATTVGFNSLEGRVYDVQANTNLLNQSGWQSHSTTNGTGQVINYEIPRDPNRPQEFYRVGVSLSTNEVVNP